MENPGIILECIFHPLPPLHFFLHLHPGPPRELVLSHMVEIRGLDGTLVHTPKHLVLSLLYWPIEK